MMFACRQMMTLTLMMFSSEMMSLRECCGQTSHHCEKSEQHHEAKHHTMYIVEKFYCLWYSKSKRGHFL